MTFKKDIRTGNKKTGIIYLPTTAPWTMVDVKEEYFIVEEVDCSGIELHSAASKAQRLLNHGVEPLCLG